MHNNLFLCPVCGYPELDEPPYDDHGCASYNICPCCGVEFGYDDSNILHSELREKWIINGMKWWSKNISPPVNWDPLHQLKNVDFND